jgi:cytochrome oxidase assembly protein ShyY1
MSTLEWAVTLLGGLAVWQLTRIADHLAAMRKVLASLHDAGLENADLIRRDVREGAQQVAREVQRRGPYRPGDPYPGD